MLEQFDNLACLVSHLYRSSSRARGAVGLLSVRRDENLHLACLCLMDVNSCHPLDGFRLGHHLETFRCCYNCFRDENLLHYHRLCHCDGCYSVDFQCLSPCLIGLGWCLGRLATIRGLIVSRSRCCRRDRSDGSLGSSALSPFQFLGLLAAVDRFPASPDAAARLPTKRQRQPLTI